MLFAVKMKCLWDNKNVFGIAKRNAKPTFWLECWEIVCYLYCPTGCYCCAPFAPCWRSIPSICCADLSRYLWARRCTSSGRWTRTVGRDTLRHPSFRLERFLSDLMHRIAIRTIWKSILLVFINYEKCYSTLT